MRSLTLLWFLYLIFQGASSAEITSSAEPLRENIVDHQVEGIEDSLTPEMLRDADLPFVNNAVNNLPEESGVPPPVAFGNLPASSIDVVELPVLEALDKPQNFTTMMMGSTQTVVEKITRISSWKRFSSMFDQRFWTLLRNLSPILVVFCAFIVSRLIQAYHYAMRRRPRVYSSNIHKEAEFSRQREDDFRRGNYYFYGQQDVESRRLLLNPTLHMAEKKKGPVVSPNDSERNNNKGNNLLIYKQVWLSDLKLHIFHEVLLLSLLDTHRLNPFALWKRQVVYLIRGLCCVTTTAFVMAVQPYKLHVLYSIMILSAQLLISSLDLQLLAQLKCTIRRDSGWVALLPTTLAVIAFTAIALVTSIYTQAYTRSTSMILFYLLHFFPDVFRVLKIFLQYIPTALAFSIKAFGGEWVVIGAWWKGLVDEILLTSLGLSRATALDLAYQGEAEKTLIDSVSTAHMSHPSSDENVLVQTTYLFLPNPVIELRVYRMKEEYKEKFRDCGCVIASSIERPKEHRHKSISSLSKGTDDIPKRRLTLFPSEPLSPRSPDSFGDGDLSSSLSDSASTTPSTSPAKLASNRRYTSGGLPIQRALSPRRFTTSDVEVFSLKPLEPVKFGDLSQEDFGVSVLGGQRVVVHERKDSGGHWGGRRSSTMVISPPHIAENQQPQKREGPIKVEAAAEETSSVGHNKALTPQDNSRPTSNRSLKRATGSHVPTSSSPKSNKANQTDTPEPSKPDKSAFGRKKVRSMTDDTSESEETRQGLEKMELAGLRRGLSLVIPSWEESRNPQIHNPRESDRKSKNTTPRVSPLFNPHRGSPKHAKHHESRARSTSPVGKA